MCLSDAPASKNLRISEIVSGQDAKRKLSSMGLRVNDILIKINDASWGPVLVKNLTTGAIKIALGRGLAEKILVEYGD